MIEEKDTFKKFGKDFQTRVLQASLTDYKFFQQILPICRQTYFTIDAHRSIWELIVDHFTKYKTLPTYESVRIAIGNVEPQDNREDCLIAFQDVQRETNIVDLQFTKDTAQEFCSNKEMEQAILDSVNLLKKGKIDAIKNRVEKALRHVHSIDMGHNYFEKFEDRMKYSLRKTVSTGFDLLDSIDYLDGGLGAGEIGVILAPTGGGKSFWLVALGTGALKAKKNVVHYTFELSEVNIGRRYDACISGYEIKKLKENYEDILKILSGFDGGKLIIKEFPTRSCNINMIKFHIERLRASGFDPGLIVLDYADLMCSTKSYEQKTWELEAIYEELRGFAMEIQVPIFTASQGNRSSIDGDIIGLDKIADAYAKAQVSDFIMTFSRNIVEKGQNKGKLYIAKNRIGLDGKVFGVNFDASRAAISIYEDDEDLLKASVKSSLDELYKEYRDNK